MQKLKQKIAKNSKKFWAIISCCGLALVFGTGGLTTGLLLRGNSPEDPNSVTNTDNSSYYMVPEIYEGNDKFNPTNFRTLLSKVAGESGATIADIDSLASSRRTAAQIRSGNSYKDVEVTFGGYEWEVVCLSKDNDGNSILTLWLDNNLQSGWTGKSSTEGAYYGFYEGGLYSDWSADWYDYNYTVTYPSNMYGTSYIRAVTLNNGGTYATSTTGTATASQSTGNVFAKFTMSSASGSVTKYLVKPNNVSWQLDQTSRGGDRAGSPYDLSNDSINNPTGANWNTTDDYGSSNITGKTGYNSWGNDYIWLPSMLETGYNSTHTGMWETSADQRKNYDGGDTDSFKGKVGSQNTQETSSIYTYSWLRSGGYNSASSSYYLLPYGSGAYDDYIYYSLAVRPCLHLNLDAAYETLPPPTWVDLAEPFDTSSHTGDSADDAYEIETAAQLAYIAQQVNSGTTTYSGKYFKQTKNIKLGKYDWVPIGKSSSIYFGGNYDGQNYKIEGITIDSTENYQGLFGYAKGASSATAEIKNVVIEKGYISGGQYTGGVIGNASSYVNISNCRNKASIKGAGYVGGITGGDGDSIKNCVNEGNIISTSSYAGGISGGSAEINNCTNLGDVTGTSYVGGIEGSLLMLASVKKCISNCTITASGNYVGGLIGINYGELAQSSAYGHIIINNSASQNVGAVFGVFDSTFLGSGYSCTACSFYGTSNIDLNIHGGTSSKSYQNWSWCNDKIQVSSSITGDSANWTKYWAVVPNMNDGLPIQKALYFVADVASSTAAEIAAALPNAQVYA